MIRRLLYFLLLSSLGACATIERSFLPEPTILDSHWRKATQDSKPIDHSPWTAFLQRYLSQDPAGVNRLSYASVTDPERTALEDYITGLEETAVTSLNRDEQLAFWVNLYNAKTVAVILEHYPVDSIRAISEGPLDPGPWNEKRLAVEGRPLSLNDIEHRIIRPIWKDARIHYVLNCAAAGCPNLASEAYRGRDIDRRMSAAARAYANDPRGVHFTSDKALIVSKIYMWFREDFGDSEEAVLEHLRGLADAPLLERLQNCNKIDGYRYDWSLNDWRDAEPASADLDVDRAMPLAADP